MLSLARTHYWGNKRPWYRGYADFRGLLCWSFSKHTSFSRYGLSTLSGMYLSLNLVLLITVFACLVSSNLYGNCFLKSFLAIIDGVKNLSCSWALLMANWRLSNWDLDRRVIPFFPGNFFMGYRVCFSCSYTLMSFLFKVFGSEQWGCMHSSLGMFFKMQKLAKKLWSSYFSRHKLHINF